MKSHTQGPKIPLQKHSGSRTRRRTLIPQEGQANEDQQELMRLIKEGGGRTQTGSGSMTRYTGEQYRKLQT